MMDDNIGGDFKFHPNSSVFEFHTPHDDQEVFDMRSNANDYKNATCATKHDEMNPLLHEVNDLNLPLKFRNSSNPFEISPNLDVS